MNLTIGQNGEWKDMKKQKSLDRYHEIFNDKISPIVGAKSKEVGSNPQPNNKSTSFVNFILQTNKKRFKILCEKKAFPSDQYALQSQVKIHNLKA
jgi:kynureninase